ncbi:MAG: hypothetical protein N3A66_04160, partial [Planctomycetota bacterium]|nr:hypothetical protein [Planctomycetota bacterium]
ARGSDGDAPAWLVALSSLSGKIEPRGNLRLQAGALEARFHLPAFHAARAIGSGEPCSLAASGDLTMTLDGKDLVGNLRFADASLTRLPPPWPSEIKVGFGNVDVRLDEQLSLQCLFADASAMAAVAAWPKPLALKASGTAQWRSRERAFGLALQQAEAVIPAAGILKRPLTVTLKGESAFSAEPLRLLCRDLDFACDIGQGTFRGEWAEAVARGEATAKISVPDIALVASFFDWAALSPDLGLRGSLAAEAEANWDGDSGNIRIAVEARRCQISSPLPAVAALDLGERAVSKFAFSLARQKGEAQYLAKVEEAMLATAPLTGQLAKESYFIFTLPGGRADANWQVGDLACGYLFYAKPGLAPDLCRYLGIPLAFSKMRLQGSLQYQAAARTLRLHHSRLEAELPAPQPFAFRVRHDAAIAIGEAITVSQIEDLRLGIASSSSQTADDVLTLELRAGGKGGIALEPHPKGGFAFAAEGNWEALQPALQRLFGEGATGAVWLPPPLAVEFGDLKGECDFAAPRFSLAAAGRFRPRAEGAAAAANWWQIALDAYYDSEAGICEIRSGRLTAPEGINCLLQGRLHRQGAPAGQEWLLGGEDGNPLRVDLGISLAALKPFFLNSGDPPVALAGNLSGELKIEGRLQDVRLAGNLRARQAIVGFGSGGEKDERAALIAADTPLLFSAALRPAAGAWQISDGTIEIGRCRYGDMIALERGTASFALSDNTLALRQGRLVYALPAGAPAAAESQIKFECDIDLKPTPSRAVLRLLPMSGVANGPVLSLSGPALFEVYGPISRLGTVESGTLELYGSDQANGALDFSWRGFTAVSFLNTLLSEGGHFRIADLKIHASPEDYTILLADLSPQSAVVLAADEKLPLPKPAGVM